VRALARFLCLIFQVPAESIDSQQGTGSP
jgi:hypothetical protein